MPAIVLGELYFGAFKSSRVQANLSKIEQFATRSVILSCDSETARHYGRIKDALRRRGYPVPENDIWIAALARQHKMTLATRDTHFSNITELELANW